MTWQLGDYPHSTDYVFFCALPLQVCWAVRAYKDLKITDLWNKDEIQEILARLSKPTQPRSREQGQTITTGARMPTKYSTPYTGAMVT